MLIEHPETGEEIEVFTKEEVDEKTSTLAEKEAEIEKLQKEYEALQKVSAEKTENFKKLNEMTAEEREAMSANQIEIFKRNEKLEDEINLLKSKVDTKSQQEIAEKKNALLSQFAGEDEELKKKLEESWDLLNIDGVDNETLARKAELSASMVGITRSDKNPLRTPMYGEAPQLKQTTQSQAKVDEAEKIADRALGLETKEDK